MTFSIKQQKYTYNLSDNKLEQLVQIIQITAYSCQIRFYQRIKLLTDATKVRPYIAAVNPISFLEA